MHRPKTVHFQVVCPSEVSQHQSICFSASRIHGFFFESAESAKRRVVGALKTGKNTIKASLSPLHMLSCGGFFRIFSRECTYILGRATGWQKKIKTLFFFFFAKCWMMVVLQKANFKSSSRWRGRLSY